jgi:predicted nucleic acid-binding protein
LSVYVDTSVAASLYVEDSHSSEAAAETAKSSKPLLLSSLGELELTNALHLALFRKEIRPADLSAALAAFRADRDSGIFAIEPMSETIYAEARRLSARWSATLGTRSLDILQVASAIVLEAEIFLTFDARQKKLAKAVGLICR